MIYISTDYVCSGKRVEAPYETDGVTGPTNLYGQLRLAGEKVILEEARKNGVVLKVPVLYGLIEKNTESVVDVLVDAIWMAQQAKSKVSMDDWAQVSSLSLELQQQRHDHKSVLCS